MVNQMPYLLPSNPNDLDYRLSLLTNEIKKLKDKILELENILKDKEKYINYNNEYPKDNYII